MLLKNVLEPLFSFMALVRGLTYLYHLQLHFKTYFLGASGEILNEAVHYESKFEFPHMKVIYPTSPLAMYSLTGTEERVWFDRYGLRAIRLMVLLWRLYQNLSHRN